jgi:hypothetical protein
MENYKMDEKQITTELYGWKHADNLGMLQDICDAMVKLVKEVSAENKRLKEELEKQQSKQENKKWQPKSGETYFFIDGRGDIEKCEYCESYYDKWRVSQGNCFKTQEEIEQHLENLKTKAELRQLAETLNCYRKINWENPDQKKYYIYYSYPGEMLQTMCLNDMKSMDIYCLDKDFLNKAIKKIGEKRLIDMIKSGV